MLNRNTERGVPFLNSFKISLIFPEIFVSWMAHTDLPSKLYRKIQNT